MHIHGHTYSFPLQHGTSLFVSPERYGQSTGTAIILPQAAGSNLLRGVCPLDAAVPFRLHVIARLLHRFALAERGKETVHLSLHGVCDFVIAHAYQYGLFDAAVETFQCTIHVRRRY